MNHKRRRDGNINNKTKNIGVMWNSKLIGITSDVSMRLNGCGFEGYPWMR